MGSNHSSTFRGGNSTAFTKTETNTSLTLQQVLDKVRDSAQSSQTWKALNVENIAFVAKMLHVPANLPLQAAIKGCQETLIQLVNLLMDSKIDTSVNLLDLAHTDKRLRTLLQSVSIVRLKAGQEDNISSTSELDDAVCAICLERFIDSSQPRANQMTACHSDRPGQDCNRRFHLECVESFIKSQCSNGINFKCPWCNTQTYTCTNHTQSSPNVTAAAIQRARTFDENYPAYYDAYNLMLRPPIAVGLIAEDEEEKHRSFIFLVFVLFWALIRFQNMLPRRR